MKISELLAVLQGEVQQARPDIQEALHRIATLPDGDEGLRDAVQTYATQLERMASASEIVGLAGLGFACAKIQEALGSFESRPLGTRAALAKHLVSWPELMLSYLDHPEDFARAEGLVAHLSQPPVALSLGESVHVMQLLAVPPEIPAELMEDAPAQRAQTASPDDVALDVPTDVDPNVYGAFIDDAPAQVARLVELTDLLATRNAQSQDIAEAKRIFHTFKGTANIIGIRGIATLSHHAEDLVEFLETHPGEAPAALAGTLIDAAACLDQMVYALLGREAPPSNALDILQSLLDWANRIDTGQLAEMLGSPESAASQDVTRVPPDRVRPEQPAPSRTSQDEDRPASALPTSEATFRVPVSTVDEMMRLIGDLATRLGEAQEHISTMSEHARDLLDRHHRVQRRLEQIEDAIDMRGLAFRRQTERTENSEFDPLELDRYNELHGTTRALMEDATDARELALAITGDLQRMSGTIHGQQYAYRDLQHLVLGTRLAPVATLTPRLNRNVRQTCQATGKHAELVVEGADVAIDAEVLNQLADPLLHVLRNAVDHGIELPADREASGKPRVGRITLSFSRLGEGVAVRCEDDGRGLNYDAIRSKALDRGLISPEQSLTERELAHLILLPGFSTREQVTEISGRGVGMDVVAQRVREMKGTLNISSTPGSGSVIEMRVQASLSIVHAVLVDAAGFTYAVPAHHVEFVLPAGEASVTESEGEEPLLHARGETLRVRYLADFIASDATPTLPDLMASHPSVVIRSQDRFLAVVVDKIHDSRDLVLKSAGHLLRLLPGLAGVSVSNSGKVLPLLDLPGLVADPSVAQMAAKARSAFALRFIERKSVLIADDSLSVRRMLKELVQDAGFDALTAKDGIEALELLHAKRPDLLLTDLEMPNMNGIELTTTVRATPEFSSLPVIMITSRSMDKHRQQAAEAGVSVYVTKPYSEIELVQHVRGALGVEMPGV